MIKTIIIIDTKISIKKFINEKYVKKYRISTLLITKKINLKLIDNFIEHILTKITIIKICLKNHVNEILYLIISLNKFDVIFDMFWIKKHDVNIEKNNRVFMFKSKYCLHYCLSNQQSSQILNKTSFNERFKLKFFKKLLFYRKKTNVNYNAISTKIFIIIITKNNYEIVVL